MNIPTGKLNMKPVSVEKYSVTRHHLYSELRHHILPLLEDVSNLYKQFQGQEKVHLELMVFDSSLSTFALLTCSMYKLSSTYNKEAQVRLKRCLLRICLTQLACKHDEKPGHCTVASVFHCCHTIWLEHTVPHVATSQN